MKKRKDSFASLFVGRWQPFHKGHQTLIESVLVKGKPVVIAIRDTEISKNNPFSTSERWTMIQKRLKRYGELVKIVVIPDIDEICYGRDVGYDIRQIQLDGEVEKISGKIQRRKKMDFPIYWITGQSGSGKTTLARNLNKVIKGTVLDGDEMRASISMSEGFSKEDRHKHNLRVARLAMVLARHNTVIVSVIAPFRETRQQIRKIIDPKWIYIKRKLPQDENKPYEIPRKPDLIVDSDAQTPKDQLRLAIEKFNLDYSK